MKCVVYFMTKVVIFFIITKNNGFFECEPLKIEKSEWCSGFELAVAPAIKKVTRCSAEWFLRLFSLSTF